VRTRYFVSFNAIIEEEDSIHHNPKVESKTLNTCVDAERMENIGDLRIIEDAIAKQIKGCIGVTIINFQAL
jgi:hypothetical protein